MSKRFIIIAFICIIVLSSIAVFCNYQYLNTNTQLYNTRSQFVKTINELNYTKNELSATNDELASTTNELAITQNHLQSEIEKAQELNRALEDANNELSIANETIAELKSEEYEFVYMGDFKITYYCDERYEHICGGNGVTASGKPTEVGVTVAADWSVLPKGSAIYIEGVGFREVQDVGGGVNGKHIDVLVTTHREALSIGNSYEGVWLLVKTS